MIILTIDPRIADVITAGRGNKHALQTPALEVIVTDAARSGACIFRTPLDIIWTDRDGATPPDGSTYIRPPRLTSPVLIVGGTTVSPTSTRIQDNIIPKGPTGSVKVKNAQIFNNSINEYSSKKGDPTPTFSKVIG